MKNAKTLSILLLGLLTMGGIRSSEAANAVVARVTDAGTNADGSVFVLFDRPVANCNGKNINRLDVANEHPAKNQVLLVAVTALASFGHTKTTLPACQDGAPQFTTGKSSIQLTADKAPPLSNK